MVSVCFFSFHFPQRLGQRMLFVRLRLQAYVGSDDPA